MVRAYSRSLFVSLTSCQSSFVNGTTVLGTYPLRWLVDRFFLESVGLSYDSIISDISSSWTGDGNPPLPRFENLIIKVALLVNDTTSPQPSYPCQLMKETISSSWYNLPRRRRYLMKSTFEWHALQDGFARLLEAMELSVRPIFLRFIRKLLTLVLLARQKSTASQATASHTPNVATNCCGKYTILWVST